MTRRLAAALAVVIVSLAVAGRARADGAPPSSSPVRSLPPGLWFRPNHYEEGRLEKQPPAPSHAAIAGLFASDGAATRAVARVQRSKVDLGFPWVVENHELQLPGRCREAIVVVAGLFATEGEARIWRQADARRRWLQIVPLAGGADTNDCGWQDDNGRGSDRHGRGIDVVYIDPAASAPGYPVELGEPDHFGDRHGELNTSGRPVCTVRAGTVHSFRNRDAVSEFGRYFPARCGARLVYVPIEDTLRSILIERLENGETLLHQLTDVACDMPNFDTWRYTRTGRKVIPGRPPTFTACSAS